MKFILKTLRSALWCSLLAVSLVPVRAADDTVKVGVLHSLSGTMAI